jgi:hypothetical protein
MGDMVNMDDNEKKAREDARAAQIERRNENKRHCYAQGVAKAARAARLFDGSGPALRLKYGRELDSLAAVRMSYAEAARVILADHKPPPIVLTPDPLILKGGAN